MGSETPQPGIFETARDVALEKGSERLEKISDIFSGIKEKITIGAKLALGSPYAAAFLGIKAAEFGKEKATEVRDSVVEAGIEAWESIVDARDKLVEGVIGARDRLVARYEQTRDATTARVVALSTRAAVWGLINVAGPVEGRLKQIYLIPAVAIRGWRAERQDTRAQKQQTRAELARQKGEAKVEVLLKKIATIQEATTERVGSLNGLRDKALAESSKLNSKAAAGREYAEKNFGRAWAAVESLQAR